MISIGLIDALDEDNGNAGAQGWTDASHRGLSTVGGTQRCHGASGAQRGTTHPFHREDYFYHRGTGDWNLYHFFSDMGRFFLYIASSKRGYQFLIFLIFLSIYSWNRIGQDDTLDGKAVLHAFMMVLQCSEESE